MSAMQTQTQTQAQTKAQTSAKKTKDLPYIVEDFLNIDPKDFSFGESKKNKIQGSSVPLRYRGKALYVKYDAKTCPFGISANKEKDKVQYVNGKTTGFSTSIQCDKDYETDPYYVKARELDNFFIDVCINNSVEWGLGGSKTKPISREVIEGYDEKGDNGKWKRIVKYAFKKNGAARVYTEYSPRLEFSLLTDVITEFQTADGIAQSANFKTAFFAADGSIVSPVDSDNMTEVLPNWSRISVLAQWQSVSLGTYGASLKPKATQIRVFPSEKLSNDHCMLGDDGDEDDNQDFSMPADSLMLTSVKPERVVHASAKPAALVVEPDADAEADTEADADAEGEGDQGEEVEGDDDGETQQVEVEVVPVTPVKVVPVKKAVAAPAPVPVPEPAPVAKAAPAKRVARVVSAAK